MKQFTGLSFDGEKYKLEIYCYNLKDGEVEKLIVDLEDKDFKLTYIDSDSLRGELQLDLYKQIVFVRKQLSSEGFSWSEDAKRIKLSA